jgi:H+/Cl- antiporter ClcA
MTVFKRPSRDRHTLLSAAAAAGLSAAFSAPFAGVLFALEELQPTFNPIYIACVLGASMAADAVASIFFGFTPVFDFRQITVLPLKYIGYEILLGILCGLLGVLFKKLLYWFQDFYEALHIPVVLRPVLPLLVSIALGLTLYDVTGGGHQLIEKLSVEHLGLGLIAALLIGKLLFTTLAYGSGTAGGIFLPLLACGALTGEALGEALSVLGLIPPERVFNFLILGMAAFFASVVKAPLTGMALILEMAGNFNNLGGLALVCLGSFVTADLLGSEPVYTVLLQRMLRPPK